MDNQIYSLQFRAFDDNMAIRGPGPYHPVRLPLRLGKGPNTYGELSIVIQIPAGLVVTAAAFREFMRKNRLDEVVEGLLAGVDNKSLEELQRPASQIQEIIHSSPLPEQVGEHILKGCQEMGQGTIIVWPVRVPFELVHFSQEQQQIRYVEALGSRGVIQAIRTCWASLFESTAIFSRELNGQSHRDARITVAAQRMIAPAFNGDL
jgi:phosphoenolpyruvate synthase/pyruvate phosphate dikinase